ncbi:MAG: PilZ domain-containing protein [Vulcanimicrobiota bacterium]
MKRLLWKVCSKLEKLLVRQTIRPIELNDGRLTFRSLRPLAPGRHRVLIEGPLGALKVTIEVHGVEDGVYEASLTTRLKAHGADRRKSERHECPLEIASPFGPAQPEDVSVTGARLVHGAPLDVHQQVTLKLSNPQSVTRLQVRATCVWTRQVGYKKFESGFHFETLRDWECRWLNRFFAETRFAARLQPNG